MPHSRQQILHSLSVAIAAAMAWVLPVMAWFDYGHTYFSDMGLYIRIGAAIGCILWLLYGADGYDGPLGGLASTATLLWAFVAAVFIVFGGIFAFMNVAGLYLGYLEAPGYTFLAFYAAVGIALAIMFNRGS